MAVDELKRHLQNQSKKIEQFEREAQIEAALEQVRARSMGMHHSSELADAASLLYQVLGSLGFEFFTCGYEFIDEEKGVTTGWASSPDGVIIQDFVVRPITGSPVFDRRYESWKRKDEFYKDDVGRKANLESHRWLAKYAPEHFKEQIFSKIPDRLIYYTCNISHGCLIVMTEIPYSTQDEQILVRFAKVFEQTYTRFLDLQKAEAQAREAQIEASLERVRAKAMAMRNSEELGSAAELFYKELKNLGFDYFINCGYVEIEEENRLRY